MMNSSLGGVDATQDYFEYNNTSYSYENIGESTRFALGWIALMSLSFITCCIGLMGNGYIIWLLGFQMKRNCFTTFILNLAVADFGFLTSIVIYDIHQITYFLGHGILSQFWGFFSHIMFMNSHFLLAAISIDRCVAVLFPIWHHCSRPKHLSIMVCVLLWVSSFLLSASMGIILFTNVFGNYNLFGLHFLVTAVVCLPSITFATVVLFIKVCLKLDQKNQGRLLLMILLTLLCFLVLAFPLNAFVLIFNFSNIQTGPDLLYWEAGIIICSCLNSSINPVIYFLVGRKKGDRSNESMKVTLQNTFKEGEATGGR